MGFEPACLYMGCDTTRGYRWAGAAVLGARERRLRLAAWKSQGHSPRFTRKSQGGYNEEIPTDSQIGQRAGRFGHLRWRRAYRD
jgi:hypothetical protein